MTYDMVKTGYVAYDTQYGPEVVASLNEASSKLMINNNGLREIGQAVDPDVQHTTHGKTEDGYIWFGTLKYKVDGSDVIILFPWHQSGSAANPEMDRSINVYGRGAVREASVISLLEKLASQFDLKREQREREKESEG